MAVMYNYHSLKITKTMTNLMYLHSMRTRKLTCEVCRFFIWYEEDKHVAKFGFIATALITIKRS